MNGTNLIKIAVRALANNKLRGFLTMLGIMRKPAWPGIGAKDSDASGTGAHRGRADINWFTGKAGFSGTDAGWNDPRSVMQRKKNIPYKTGVWSAADTCFPWRTSFFQRETFPGSVGAKLWWHLKGRGKYRFQSAKEAGRLRQLYPHYPKFTTIQPRITIIFTLFAQFIYVLLFYKFINILFSLYFFLVNFLY